MCKNEEYKEAEFVMVYYGSNPPDVELLSENMIIVNGG
jgi:hypothetical protein